MRLVVGLLLVVAAILKAIQLVIEPGVVVTTPFGNWLLPILVGIELGIGLLILSGFFWRRIRWFALLLFTAFAVFSLSLAIGGAASCGCFGPIEVHPLWTFLLDAIVAVGLLVAIARNRTCLTPSSHALRQRRQTVVMTIAAVTIVGPALLMRYVGSRTVLASDSLPTAGSLVVVLEPENWVGKPLPIADAIDLDLTQGHWIVLLHRHDCPVCQEAVPRYQELALRQRVALVEVPPYAELYSSATGAAHNARLSSAREWFVQTPVELRLHNGVVLAVKYGHGE